MRDSMPYYEAMLKMIMGTLGPGWNRRVSAGYVDGSSVSNPRHAIHSIGYIQCFHVYRPDREGMRLYL